MHPIISDVDIQRRLFWIGEIKNLSGNFADDFERLEAEIRREIEEGSIDVLISHLRLCGNIPEEYYHDSSEEKLYSKYTDLLLAIAFEKLGLRSEVLKERADAADVDVYADGYDFVADAKTFRLSRTAKNQKDFKIAAMHGWKKGKQYAMVVCPIDQLPATNSQIYASAVQLDVCIFTYSHLSLLLNYAQEQGDEGAQDLLLKLLQSVSALEVSKSSSLYWKMINSTMLNHSEAVGNLWQYEQQAAEEARQLLKDLDIKFLKEKRESVGQMTIEEARAELVKLYKFDTKIKAINKITDNGIFELN